MTTDAIRYYHDLLEKKHLSSTVEMLESKREQLAVAGRPVCTVLRPFFLERKTYEFVKKASTLMMRGIAAMCRHLLSNPSLRAEMELSESEETILRLEPGYGLPDVSARLDGFLTPDRFQFVEYNADSPGGIGYGEVLSEVFAGMPLLREFSARYPFEVFPVRTFVFHSLLHAYHLWGGKGLPAIAILDWKEAPTYPEFLLFQEHFEKHGCRVKIGDPRDLEYKDGKLRLGDFHIELVYKRLVVAEMLDRLGLNHPLVHAAKDRAVCVANGFGVQLATKKNLFALLSDPMHSKLLDANVRQALAEYVPWTRRVLETKTDYRGKTVDLIAFVQANKDTLVLKPGGEYGGRGVVLGWEVNQVEWETKLAEACKGSYIVQERVNIGSESFPSIENGNLVFRDRFFDLDPYVWNGTRIEGCGVRLSSVSLLNVSAGGGSGTPLFLLK